MLERIFPDVARLYRRTARLQGPINTHPRPFRFTGPLLMKVVYAPSISWKVHRIKESKIFKGYIITNLEVTFTK